MRTKADLEKLRRDTEEIYDVAFGKMYREKQGKTTSLTPQVIAADVNLNNLLDLIIEEAIDLEARNIDVSLDADGYGIVQYRIGRDMVDIRILDPDAVEGLTIVARKRAGVDYEKEYKSEINGGIRYKYLNQRYDLRCAFIPTILGMSMSIRILYSEVLMEDISQLGLPINVEKAYRDALKAKQGLILLTGATSSGKTTTQYTGLNTIRKEFGTAKNIRTVENPVEYMLSGVKQTQVNEGDGETFDKIAKSFLRGDPDVILVGEINDAATAQTVIRMASSGHLVLSTLHTNNTIEVTRVLQHYGINHIDLGNALVLVINQVLENKLCEDCRVRRNIMEDEFRWIEKRLGVNSAVTVLYEQSGRIDGDVCQSCNGRGYKGSTLVVEMLEANYAYQRALNKVRDNTYELEKILLTDDEANYYPIGRDVFRHLKEGNIDLDTAKRIMRKQSGETLLDKKNRGEDIY